MAFPRLAREAGGAPLRSRPAAGRWGDKERRTMLVKLALGFALLPLAGIALATAFC